jgi:protein TonB
MNRPDISRLKKNRILYLNLGFIIALSLTIMGFNYTVYDDGPLYSEIPIEMEEEELIDVVRTVYPERKQAPPTVQPAEEIVEPVVEFIDVPDPAPIEPLTIDVPDPAPVPAPYVAPPLKKPAIAEVKQEVEENIFIVVEQMPRFQGCEDAGLDERKLKACADQRLLEYIYRNIKYPSIARENGIEGTVMVTFVVEKDGSITIPKVLRDIGGGCGKEVMRVVKQMPLWVPGEQRGRKVRVQFNLPVQFKLQ